MGDFFERSMYLTNKHTLSMWSLALHMVMWGLRAAAQPWKPVPWGSDRVLMLPEEVWNSVLSIIFIIIIIINIYMRFSTRQWVCMVYHFVSEPWLLQELPLLSNTQQSTRTNLVGQKFLKLIRSKDWILWWCNIFSLLNFQGLSLVAFRWISPGLAEK